jgi:hypothetical protein
MTGPVYYDAAPPPLFERVARIAGQSNFLSLLAGVEAGQDTTQDMGALSFSRGRGATPEALEAYVAKSSLHKLPLMSMAFMAIMRAYGPPEKEWPWIQGAVADAFMEMQDGRCKPARERARKFGVREYVYASMRKVAGRFFDELVSSARAGYSAAMRRESDSPGFRHNTDRKGGEIPEFYWARSVMRGMGHFRELPLSSRGIDECGDEDDDGVQFTPNDVLFREDNGWVEANAPPGPVLTLYGEEAEEHCRKHPAQSNRPHSL